MNIGMAFFEFDGPKGIARAVAELSLSLAHRGHDVSFHCVHPPAVSPHPRIRFRRVAAFNSFRSYGLVSFAVAGARSLRRGAYDITHTHGSVIGSDVITAHSCHKAALEIARKYPSTRRSCNLGIADTFRLYLEMKNYGERRFKKLVAVSQGVKRELMEMYGLQDSDICTIPNGVDVERFHPKLRYSIGMQTRTHFGIRADEFVAILVANEFERKGLLHCIDALALLERVGVKLLVVGDDRPERYRAYARQRGVTDRILFCGSVPRIEDYYAASDVFLLPTLYEAFSLATLEAAASGLPLLVTKVNGTEELIQEGLNGLFVERNAEHIAQNLLRLREDEQLRATLGVGARASALHYTWNTIADRTLRVYEEVR